jgi:two-component system sensor histidine kinase and response regulator WspE
VSGFEGLDLFELFKGEVEAHAAALNEGLLQLEADPANAAPVAALMRAAHSIKGAARVVGIDAVVSLAHQMEDAMVRIQKGQEPCAPHRVEQLLQATDLLASLQGIRESEMAAWSSEHGPEINALLTALAAPAGGKEPAPSPVTTAEPEGPAKETSHAGDSDAVQPATDARPVANLPAAPSRAPVPSGAASTLPSEASTTLHARSAEPVANEIRTVRVNADNLDRMMRLAGESMVEGRRFPQVQRGLREFKSRLRMARETVDAAARRGVDLQEAREQLVQIEKALQRHGALLEATFRRTEEVGTRLYHEVIGSRMRPFGDATAGFPRLVRDLARSLGKRVRFELEGVQTPVDRDILARLDAPLNHLLRNALDHGVERPDARVASGKSEIASLRMEARHHAGMLEVRIRDDGAGIDPERIRGKVIERRLQSESVARGLGRAELLEFLFLPGFSTASSVTEVSGRGVGLDVVHQTMRDLGGSVRVESEPGRGTTFVMSLPITLSVIRAALVQVAGQTVAFPLARIERIVRIAPTDMSRAEGRLQFDLDGAAVGVLEAASVLEMGQAVAVTDALLNLLVIGPEHERCALLVEGFLGERDMVVRPLDARLGRVPHVAAAAIDEDGLPLLVMDVEDLLVSIRRGLGEGVIRGLKPGGSDATHTGRKRILVADDSITVREVERQMLQRLGHEVDVAVDGVDAWNQLCAGRHDLLVTDVDMPRLNGIELVRQLRRDPRFAHLPVAIVSYKDRAEDRAAGLQAGANAYLTKGSFQDQTFIDTIHDLIGEPAE